MTKSYRFLVLVAHLWATQLVIGAPVVHHNMNIRLSPAQGTLEVEDRISIASAQSGSGHEFLLHADLEARIDGQALAPIFRDRTAGRTPRNRYLLKFPPGEKTTTIRYRGVIRQGFSAIREGVGRTRKTTSGMISENGVFLDGSSAWYPQVSGTLQTFALRVELPRDWMAISQGQGPKPRDTTEHSFNSWEELKPQDDIYLVAGPFHFYSRETPYGESQVFLRSDDVDLAERYLDATGKYLSYYSKMLGRYPYAKFALVENFWSTGYGMPSFTLLGSKVIRLPFILHTSYPHEILHNWWGNGVYVDYEQGNWSEGLTTYLSDYLLQEQRLLGKGYRRSALQRYQDFVRSDNDFPLRKFRGRHDTASQAVGYDKSLMFFHMLRKALGDDAFFNGLRAFYSKNKFQQAGYEALQSAFEGATGKSLQSFFSQWTSRTGAPALRVGEVDVGAQADGYQLRVRIVQDQPEDPYFLRIPLVIEFAGESPPLRVIAENKDRDSLFEINLPAMPQTLHIDPEFDLFRRVDPGEVPPTLGALFGAQTGYILLPENADRTMASAYRELAERWVRGYPGLRILPDSKLESLPEDSVIWLLGWENSFRGTIESLLPRNQGKLEEWQISINGEQYVRQDYSLALVVRDDNAAKRYLGWIGAHTPEALPGLARKLPHYGKFSYLVFTGTEPENQVKGHWQVTGSPLSVALGRPREHEPGLLDLH